MAEESVAGATVDTLELEIRASAEKAADKIRELSASVGDFGKNIAGYVSDLSNFASAIERIAKAAQSLSGIKNIKSVIGNAASASSAAKAKSVGDNIKTAARTAIKEKAWLINQPSQNVGPRTRYYQNAQGETRRFEKTSDQVAKDLLRDFSMTGTRKDLAARIAEIRTQHASAKSDEDYQKVTDQIIELGREIAGSAGDKNVSSLIKQLNEAFGEYGGKYIGVADRDIAGIGSIKEANAILGNAGASFRFRKWGNGGSLGAKPGIHGADEVFEKLGIDSPEELIDRVAKNSYRSNTHRDFLGEAGFENEEDFFEQIMPDITRAILGDTRIAGKGEIEEAMRAEAQAKAATAKVKAEMDAAFDQYEKQEAKASQKFYNDHPMDWDKWEAQAAAEEAKHAMPDNTEREIAEWKAMEDKRDAESAAEGVKKQAVVWRDLADAIREATKEDKHFNEEMDTGAGPHLPNSHRSFEDYTGVDHRKEARDATDEFNKELGRLVSKGDFEKNIRANIKEMDKYGKGNTREFFAKLKARNEAIKAQEANDAQESLRTEASMTSEQFMEENKQADILQMKLAGVKEQLDKALNSEDYDPGKIARLADQYQKLSDKIKETGEASKDASTGTKSFKEILEALGDTVKGSHVGKLVSQFARIARLRAMRAIVKGIGSALKEGIGNLYQWSSAMSGPFASAMDTIASKSMFAKNSIATAFAPAIEALVPLINTVVGWIHTASNAIAQFFALLSGSTTWTEAVETTEKWGEATKSAAKGAGKEVKDLLADWDELNIIQGETGTGGGSGSGKKTPDYSKMFKESKVFDKWTEKFDTIKKIVESIGIGIAGWFVADAVEDFIGKLGFAGDKVASIFSRIKKGIVGAVLLSVSFSLAEDVGSDIAENGLNWQNALEGIGSAIAGALGGSFVASAVGLSGAFGAIAGLSIAVLIGLNAYIDKKRELTYAKLAQDSFASTGKNGFDVEKYKTEVEKELNKRIGTLSVTVEAFKTYGPASDQLHKATVELAQLGEYVFGGKKLTTAQAEEFKKNWETVFQSINIMHTATWDTINLGIADAMKNESEESKKYLAELQKDLIEVQRLTGGGLAAWRTEMSMITGRISAGTASQEDFNRYAVLMKLISDTDVSSSLSAMKEWEETVKGFDFGDGEEAVTNATSFIDDMGDMYSNATDEVNAWGKAQEDAVKSAKKELEALKEEGLIGADDYNNSIDALNRWETEYKKKVKGDLAEIERLKADTYGKIFDQVLVGYVRNQESGGSGTQYYKTVEPLIKKLQEAGYELPDQYDWLRPGKTDGLSGALDGLWGFLGGVDKMDNMLVESKYATGTNYAFTYDTPPGFILNEGEFVPVIGEPEPVSISVETDVPDDFVYDEDAYALKVKDASITVSINAKEEGNITRNEDGSWEWAPDKQETVDLGNPNWEKVDGKWVRKSGVKTEAQETVKEATQDVNNSDEMTIFGIPTEGGWFNNAWKKLTQLDPIESTGIDESSLNETWSDIQEYADTHPIDLGFDEDDEDISITDLVEPSEGGVSGSTAWYPSLGSEEVELDASAAGLATDEGINNLMNTTANGMSSLDSTLKLIMAIANRIEESARTTAAKDLTVTINPSSVLGRTTGAARTLYGRVTGEMGG